MAIDYSAIATVGFYPTPTPTASERMAFAASWGYLSVAGDADDGGVTLKRSTILNEFSISIGIGEFGLHIK